MKHFWNKDLQMHLGFQRFQHDLLLCAVDVKCIFSSINEDVSREAFVTMTS